MKTFPLLVGTSLALALAGFAAGCTTEEDLGSHDARSRVGESSSGADSTPEAGAPSSSGASNGGPKRVFVTSVQYTGNLRVEGGGATGLAGADALCNAHAADANLGGAWVAWLSTESSSAFDRVTSNGPYYRTDGTLAFSSKLDIRRTPAVAVELDERGAQIAPLTSVWTGTTVTGAPAGSGYLGEDCVQWQQASPSSYGLAGDAEKEDDGWTSATSRSCDKLSSLYCFEQ